jgi:hypothetical protein
MNVNIYFVEELSEKHKMEFASFLVCEQIVSILSLSIGHKKIASFNLSSLEDVSIKGLFETGAFVFVTEQGQGMCSYISGTSEKDKRSSWYRPV